MQHCFLDICPSGFVYLSGDSYKKRFGSKYRGTRAPAWNRNRWKLGGRGRWTSILTPEECAEKCDNYRSDCRGFMHSRTQRKCYLFNYVAPKFPNEQYKDYQWCSLTPWLELKYILIIIWGLLNYSAQSIWYWNNIHGRNWTNFD